MAKSMTPDELRQSLIAAGIIAKSGKLTAHYVTRKTPKDKAIGTQGSPRKKSAPSNGSMSTV